MNDAQRPTELPKPGLWAELRRRNVIRMAGLYLVGAWLIVQVAETLLPAFDVPGWVLRALIILLGLGFVPALVFSWIYELTPDGLKRDREVDPAQSISSTTALRMDRLILAGLALLIVIFVGDLLTRAPAPEALSRSTSEPGDSSGTAAAAKPRLAVLPLANFSPDPSNAFFADGLHDDLLTALSRLKGIEVISRTTMHTFKDSRQKLAQIAAELGATHVIEGSVRRDAENVRLTIQLIDPASDAHLWAENYDRPISDSLNLQSAVAREVAGALRLAIGGTQDAPSTTVPAAYDLFLQARLTSNLEDSYQLLEAALLLDPGFSQARAERAIVACMRIWFNEPEAKRLVLQARADIDQAKAEQPNLLEAQLAQAYYVYYVERDYPAALKLTERALRDAPNEARVLRAYSLLLRRVGRSDEAIDVARQALALDPADPDAHFGLVDMLIFDNPASREAIAIADAAIERFPRAQTERLRLYRAVAVSALTGAPMRRADLLADDISEQEVRLFFSFAPADQPSAQSLAYLKQRQEGWCDGAPCALWLAREAEYLGDEAVLAEALDVARRMYAAEKVAPSYVGRDTDFDAGLAYYLALSGAPKEQLIQHVEQTFARVRETEPLDRDFFAVFLGKALAAAGERERAMAMFNALGLNNQWLPIALYQDPYLQRWMQGDPEFAALRERVAAKFEPL